MKLIRGIVYVVLFFLTGECVDPADIKVPFAGGFLVVDGNISNADGPYTINLARATGLTEKVADAVPETGAQITVMDDQGNQEPFFEFSAGVYKTTHAAFKGQLGRPYHIHIKTKSGKEFESDPEVLKNVGTIDNIYYEFEYHEEFTSKGYVPANRFKVYVDATGLANSDNLMRWRWSGTYKVETFPQYVHDGNTLSGPLCMPRPCRGNCFPLPCSGVSSYVRDGACQFTRYAECTCCECWISEEGNVPIISDDQLVVDAKFNKVFIGNVPVTPRLFYDKYYVEVEQMSLSQTAFDFWRIIKIQKTGSSSIFQPVNGKVRGNIHPTNNTDDVIGLFTASATAKKSIFLKREFVPYRINPIDTVAIRCQDLTNSSNVKPPFWQ